MTSYYGNRLVKLVSPQCDKIFTLELGGNEEELKDLIATILNISKEELKGLKDTQSNYYTFSSAINNQHLTNTHSQYYTIVLSNAFNEYKQTKKSSLNLNALSNNFNQAVKAKRRSSEQGDKQKQLMCLLAQSGLIDRKHIEKIKFRLKEGHDKSLNALFADHNAFDLKKLAKRCLDFIAHNDTEEDCENNPSPEMNHNDVINSVEEHFEDKNDVIILRTLLSLDNEAIKRALNKYKDSNNKPKLVDALRHIVLKYKDKLKSNCEALSCPLSSLRDNEGKQEALISSNYTAIMKTLRYDHKAIVEYAKSSLKNYHQLFELNKDFSDTNNERNSIELMRKYSDNFIQSNFLQNLTQEEVSKYTSIANDADNNQNIVKAFEVFRTKGFDVTELKEMLHRLIKDILSQKKKILKKSESLSVVNNKGQMEANGKKEKMVIVKENGKERKTITLVHQGSALLLNKQYTQRDKNSNLVKFSMKESEKKLNEEVSNEAHTRSKPMRDFIKVIASFSFEEKVKAALLQLLSAKDEKIMKLFDSYQKNRLSLTKNSLLNIIKSTMPHNTTDISSIKNISAINSNASHNPSLPNSSWKFTEVIAYFEKEKIISQGESAFIQKRYQNNDEMLLSFWEVFKTSEGEFTDLIDSLKTFISHHHNFNKRSLDSKTPVSIENTKKDMLHLLRSKEKSELEVIKKKQKHIISLLIKEELIEGNSEEFFNMRIEEEDLMISSVFEVFSVTRDHRDFIESLNLIKEIMFNKDNNKNDHNLGVLNALLMKSAFSEGEKEVLRGGLLLNDQTILSIIELYEKEKDLREAIETLEIAVRKKRKD